MGKAALEGRPGIEKVTSGWHAFRETNTAVYDPDLIKVEEMVNILKKKRTYRGTVDQP